MNVTNIMRKYSIIEPDVTLQNNLMIFGFECGEGWHPLIVELLDKIQSIVDKNPDYKDLRVVQIKEKYATLRVYLNYEPDEIWNLIQEYEQKSAETCELCSKKGRERDIGHWYKTLCDKCYKDINNEQHTMD